MPWLHNLLTKDDNVTFDEIKVGGFMVLVATSVDLGITSLLCFWCVMVRGESFDANAYLNGVSSVVTACAAVLGGMGIGAGVRDNLTRRNGSG